MKDELVSQPTQEEYSKKYKIIIALIYICVLFLDRLDVTIVNVAMPTFAKDFQVPVTRTEWISTGFLLSLTMVIPISGWLADKYGSKRIFVIAVTLFTLGSLLCGLSWNLISLVSFRVLQGIGGGLLVPVGMAMTYRAFSQKEYPKVAAYTLMPTLLGPAVGPTVGGFILEYFSWRLIFLINLPICLTAIILSILHLKEDSLPSAKHPLDKVGFILIAFALLALLYSFSLLGSHGVTPTSMTFLTIAIICLILFILQEKRTAYPLIHLKYFKIPLFVQSNLLQLSLQICYYGSMFIIALYFQVCLGMSPVQSGICMFAQPVGTIFMLPFSPRIFAKIGPRYPVIFGMFGLTVTTLALLGVRNLQSVFLITGILLVRGIVIGFVNAPVQITSMFDIPKQENNRASAIFNVGRQVAISLGISLSSMLLAWGLRRDQINIDPNMANPTSFPIFQQVFIVISIVAFIGVIIGFTIDNKRILAVLKS